MVKCGICLKQDECDKCKKCYVGICDDCRHMTEYDTDLAFYAPIASICDFCMPIGDDDHVYYMLTAYRYCRKCDRSLFWGCRTNEEDCIGRQVLPHYKAKPIIEEIYYIKGIAQIIFDYYYEPRRYFEGEI